MAKLTLLDMTQNILTAMSSDNVNSISDTQESLDVAEVIKETYYDLLSRRDYSWLGKLTQLVGLADNTNPTKMQIPQSLSKILWIKYQVSDIAELRWTIIDYQTPLEFLNQMHGRNSTVTEVTTVTDSSGATFLILNDRRPSYWTSFDDDFIVFDAYNSSVDTTLQSSKSLVHAIEYPTWTATDTFIPDLPEHLFSMVLAEAKSTAMFNFKEVANPKEEQKSRKQQVRMQYASWRENGSPTRPHYGRK